MRLAFAIVGLCLPAMVSTITANDLSRGEDRIGLPAPPLALKQWLHSPPLELAELRGKVVLIRWWTDGCPFCAATAPALREFDRKFAGRGLHVIGVFHPKPPGDWSVERMRIAGQRLGFSFPVALDAEWTALNRWWPDPEQRGWTSVSFLVDRRGIIRYVHPGGEFHESRDGSHARCDASYKEIGQLIQKLLAEPK